MWRVVARGSSGTLLKFSGLLIPIQLPQSTTHSSVIGFLLAVCAATACAHAGTEKTESQRNPKPTAAPRLSSAPEQGLKLIVGDRGLNSLSFNRESLLASPESGELQAWKRNQGHRGLYGFDRYSSNLRGDLFLPAQVT